MTWFGWILIVLYGFSISHNLIRAGDGGYTIKWTPGMLLFTVFLQVLGLLGIIFIGTGAV